MNLEYTYRVNHDGRTHFISEYHLKCQVNESQRTLQQIKDISMDTYDFREQANIGFAKSKLQSLLLAQKVDASEVLTVEYTNWRGETGIRRIIPSGKLTFGANERHKEPQWLLEALDMDKGEMRTFALKDMRVLPTTDPTAEKSL